MDLVKPDQLLYIHNAKVEMYKLTMRLVCDAKWGKVIVEGRKEKQPAWKVNVRIWINFAIKSD